LATPQHLVVMGVSGSGKTTIATLLAERLGYTFADADAFHSPENVAKMARREPLTDADRQPWLESLAAWIAARHTERRSTVLACSALKRRYRDALRAGARGSVAFVFLATPRAVLEQRMAHRTGHYMPLELLDSQLATLEPLAADERGVTVDGTPAPPIIIANILEKLSVTN
jgi:gluconokinase